MVWSAIASAVAPAVVGGLFGSSSAKSTNKANAQAAAAANAFTEKQLKNRHQWEVADLKAAGLNPVLSAGGTPSIGGSAVADVINPADSAVNAANTALAAKRLTEEIKNIREDTELKKASQVAQLANAKSASSAASLNDAHAANTRLQQPMHQANNRLFGNILGIGSASDRAASSAKDLYKAENERVKRERERRSKMSPAHQKIYDDHQRRVNKGR